MTRLFTFVVEHEGASSISQLKADDIQAAFGNWRRSLGARLGTILSSRDIVALKKDLASEEPTAVKRRMGVWFACGRSAKGFARITIVATALE